ncbi:MAG TPA: hypothetical protein GX526_04575 [Thermoanaerobacterales bacterium]|nr:hypothetical protein [Thermoanaerobacterales bacterium]
MLIEISNGIDTVSSSRFDSASIEINYDNRMGGFVKRFSGTANIEEGEPLIQFLEENPDGLTLTVSDNGEEITSPLIACQLNSAFRDLINKICIFDLRAPLKETV